MEIPLTRGAIAIVDDKDFELVSQFKWRLGGHGSFRYAIRHLRTDYIDGKRVCRTQRMHRLLCGLSPDIVIDHVNGNGLDNRRENLRVTTYTGNNRHRRPIVGGSSKYKGVSFFKRDGNWRAQIKVNDKPIRLGSFKDEVQAAQAYDEAAKEHFGEYAYLNFPPEGHRQAI